jgi:hypothetical protein
MDAIENIYRGESGQQLTDLHGLGMEEVVGDFTTKQLGATYFWGRKPIDAIWATSDVTVANACMMLVGYGVGDHRLFCRGLCNRNSGGHRLTENSSTCSPLSEHEDQGMCSAVQQSSK